MNDSDNGFVEFPRLVARNLKVDGSNGSLLEHI